MFFAIWIWHLFSCNVYFGWSKFVWKTRVVCTESTLAVIQWYSIKYKIEKVQLISLTFCFSQQFVFLRTFFLSSLWCGTHAIVSGGRNFFGWNFQLIPRVFVWSMLVHTYTRYTTRWYSQGDQFDAKMSRIGPYFMGWHMNQWPICENTQRVPRYSFYIKWLLATAFTATTIDWWKKTSRHK